MIRFDKIWTILTTKFPAFMEGVSVTLQLAFFTVLLGSLLGLIVAVFRRTRIWPLRWLMNAYVALPMLCIAAAISLPMPMAHRASRFNRPTLHSVAI